MNSTDVRVPEATPNIPKVSEIVAKLEQALQDAVGSFRQNPTTPESTLALETAVATCCRESCRALLESEYNAIEPAVIQDCPVRMRLAGEEYKRRHKRPNTIATLFGPIVLQRYWYEAVERGECGICPLEMRLGIEAGLATPALTQRIGLDAVDHTQQQVLDRLERDHAVQWSVDSLRKFAASLSDGISAFRQETQEQKILAWLKQAEKSKGRHQPVLAVGRDGIMIPMRHGANQEASVATITVLDRRRKRLGTVYLAQMPESGQGTLSEQLTALLQGVLAKWEGCPLRYVYVTDAGTHPQEYYENVLRKMIDPQRPGRLIAWQWIVDFWHACCYLTKLRESLFGDSGAGWVWFQRMRHWLRHRKFGITQILRSATQHRNLAGALDTEREKKFWEGYRYLHKYARCMAYERYHREGKPIGSGVTEAACKTMFTQRFKQSGMRWEVEGGQVIVDLRVLKLSGVWQETFQQYLQSRIMPIAIENRSCRKTARRNLQIAA